MSRPVQLSRTGPEGQRFLGPYLLQECIGKGGTAVLYTARRTGAAGFEKQVVVKTILPEHAGNARFVALFQEEAKLQAQLFHANIAQVQDFGIMRGTPFLELEVLKGWNARQLFDRLQQTGRRLPAAIAALVLNEACRGLAYAHAFVDDKGRLRPIIHRDVSLQNVMLCRDGAVKIIDFGLASVTEGETLSIETFHGKLAYMSPEQLESGQLDRSADVFGFGVVMWELLTGRRLFAADTDEQTLRNMLSAKIELPSHFNAEVGHDLDAVVMKALARDPLERYSSAGELLTALEALNRAPASRGALLSYLGSVAPEEYTSPCEACGAAVPHGRECNRCCTFVEPAKVWSSAEPPNLSSRPIHLSIVRTPPHGSPLLEIPDLRSGRARYEQGLATVLAVAGSGIDASCEAVGRLASWIGRKLRRTPPPREMQRHTIGRTWRD
jgi:serine/threonine protein kinase